MTTLDQARRQFAQAPEPASEPLPGTDSILVTDPLGGLPVDEEIITPAPGFTPQTRPLTGYSFTFTGKLTRPRSKVMDEVRANGGEATTHAKDHTHFVVVGSFNDGHSSHKLERARYKGCVEITEADLNEYIARGVPRQVRTR